jgi:hypothetical protein
MRCEQHPERWPDSGIDNAHLEAIMGCDECLLALEHRLSLLVDANEIPLVSQDMADKIMLAIEHEKLAASMLTDSTWEFKSRRTLFIHYLIASAATIILVITGCFNMLLDSNQRYGGYLNKTLNDMSKKANANILDSNDRGDDISRQIKDRLKYFYSPKK